MASAIDGMLVINSGSMIWLPLKIESWAGSLNSEIWPQWRSIKSLKSFLLHSWSVVFHFSLSEEGGSSILMGTLGSTPFGRKLHSSLEIHIYVKPVLYFLRFASKVSEGCHQCFSGPVHEAMQCQMWKDRCHFPHHLQCYSVLEIRGNIC